jgi:hypothetical protein
MHFTYKESCAAVCEAVGYNKTLNLADTPNLEYKLVAYLEGNVIECEDEKTWNKFKLREKIVTPESKLARDSYRTRLVELEAAANDHFETKLVDYFSELSPAQYKVCYNKAYEDAHSAGYDAVANKMEDYVQLCQEFVLAEGKE